MNTVSLLELTQLIDQVAESLSPEIEALAPLCVEAFSSKKAKTQMSNLEQIGRTSQRFHDIIAYAMRQTGKEKKQERWRKSFPTKTGQEKPFGHFVISFLETIQQESDKALAKASFPSDKKNELRVRVAAICLRNLNSYYLYLSLPKGES